ncbi:hypothetical protein Q1695_000502 [Nippostrongylus brasiliensis]|nr:hypothetical protein Q1695_000502 [Nippostrongylus brasiliensis]
MLTALSLLSMVVFITFCSRCRIAKNRSADDLYAAACPSVTDAPSHRVQFRSGAVISGDGERRSQPVANKGRIDGLLSRASVPVQMGRALPRVPADSDQVVEKTRADITVFNDEVCNPMYECIDTDNDLRSDKASEPVRSRERKYDYPVFSARKVFAARSTQMDYQYDSPIYTVGGSDDPYSSIASEPCRIYADDDRAAGDPLYAKVNSAVSKKMIERTEQDVDQLYSTIRRPSLKNTSVAGPSRVTMEDVMEGGLDLYTPSTLSQNIDEESTSSREPSYRYITVRENANIIRERLRQQGQLSTPSKEHYYSVIGNEYETVGDVQSATYNGPTPPQDVLSISLSTASPQDFVPPPPTSPIPFRTPNDSVAVEAPEESTSATGTRLVNHTNGDVYANLNVLVSDAWPVLDL